MAETAKLDSLDTAQKTLAVIRQRIDKADRESLGPITSIDRGEFDEHILPHGRWPCEHAPADMPAETDGQ